MVGILRKNKGQSMTELVLVAPLFVMIMIGMLQFTMVMIDFVKLQMVEREVMMYCSTYEYSELYDHVNDFAKEYAESVGLNPDNLNGKDGGGEIVYGAEDYIPHTGFWGTFYKIIKFIPFLSELVGDIYGADVWLTYESKLFGPFKAMTGKDSIVLKARIHTGIGDCFTMNLSLGHVLEVVFNDIISGAKWIVNLIYKCVKGLLGL